MTDTRSPSWLDAIQERFSRGFYPPEDWHTLLAVARAAEQLVYAPSEKQRKAAFEALRQRLRGE